MGSSERIGRARVLHLDSMGQVEGDEAVEKWQRAMQHDETQALLREVLGGIIDRMKPAERQVLEMFFFERLTEAEMAAELHRAPGTVSDLKRTALRSLTRELALAGGYQDERTGRRGRPARDYDAETEAAWAYLSRALTARGQGAE